MAWSPNGELIATGSNDKTVKLMRYNDVQKQLEGREVKFEEVSNFLLEHYVYSCVLIRLSLRWSWPCTMEPFGIFVSWRIAQTTLVYWLVVELEIAKFILRTVRHQHRTRRCLAMEIISCRCSIGEAPCLCRDLRYIHIDCMQKFCEYQENKIWKKLF